MVVVFPDHAHLLFGHIEHRTGWMAQTCKLEVVGQNKTHEAKGNVEQSGMAE